MSNLAYKLEKRQVEHKQNAKQIVKKGGITKGEIILLTFLAIGVFIASVYVIANYASIYTVNKEIQEVQAQIDKQTKTNEDLQLQVTELSEPGRILESARKQGLKLDEKNVKLAAEQ